MTSFLRKLFLTQFTCRKKETPPLPSGFIE